MFPAAEPGRLPPISLSPSDCPPAEPGGPAQHVLHPGNRPCGRGIASKQGSAVPVGSARNEERGALNIIDLDQSRLTVAPALTLRASGRRRIGSSWWKFTSLRRAWRYMPQRRQPRGASGRNSFWRAVRRAQIREHPGRIRTCCRSP